MRNFRREGLTLSFLLCAGTAPLAAQTPAHDDAADLLALLNTPVSSASKRAERTLETPGVVSLVTREQAEAYGWTSLNDVLYSLPGFGPSQDYDRHTVSGRGLFEGWNNNHLLHLIDGIPFNDNIYGTAYTWEVTPLFLARTVEVVRGPGSALYGSNATSGVVQMKSLSASDLNGGEAQIRIGSQGERIYDFAVGKVGDWVSALVGFNSYGTDGRTRMDYDGSMRTLPGGSLAQFPVSDGHSSQYMWAKLEGEGDLAGWSFQYHRQAWDYGTGHGWLWQIPDLPEQLQEKREILALGYASGLPGGWRQEYLVSYQRHDIKWNLRFYPDQALAGTYPDGVYEFLDTGASDLFGRGQWSWEMTEGAELLFGVEATRFLYAGDNAHTSNIEMTTFTPNPGNATLPLGPWLQPILNHPILNTGLFAQLSYGNLLDNRLKVVLGLRSDRTAFNYDLPGAPSGSKSYANVSPRLALVYTATPNLAIKAMTGRAFRSPSPSELAGANTLTLGSNLQTLEPETLLTSELAVDWIVTPNLDWRTNVYRTKFSNEIAYSASNFNLSTNVYTLTTQGLESELLYGYRDWKGYVNASFATRLGEQILDQTIAASPDHLTWEPAQRYKAGVIYGSGGITAALSGLWQGRVARRASDVGVQPMPLVGTLYNVDAYRPTSLDPWFSLDAKVGVSLRPGTSLSLAATNLLDTHRNALVKNLAFPFDYQGDGRRVSLILRSKF